VNRCLFLQSYCNTRPVNPQGSLGLRNVCYRGLDEPPVGGMLNGQILTEEADGTSQQGTARLGWGSGSALLTDNLDQHPLPTPAVELAVEYLLPRAKVEPPIRDCHDDLAAHDLPLEVGISIVLASAIVTVLADRFVWGLA
jgi:hypothetical protein